jgi:hypothetical protein
MSRGKAIGADLYLQVHSGVSSRWSCDSPPFHGDLAGLTTMAGQWELVG